MKLKPAPSAQKNGCRPETLLLLRLRQQYPWSSGISSGLPVKIPVSRNAMKMNGFDHIEVMFTYRAVFE